MNLLRALALAVAFWGGPVIAVERPNSTVVDDDGRTLTLPRPARRILSLSPHATELVFAAGAGAALVGVSARSDFPPEAAGLASIGDASGLDRERVLALRPDLAIAWPSGNRSGDLEWLETRGIPVYRSEPRRLADIAENLREIGRLAGTGAAADAAADRFLASLERLREGAGRERNPVVFYQLWPQPLMTVGGGTLVDQVLRLCGGENPFAALSEPAPRVSREAVILADPEVMIAAVEREDASGDPFADWRRWPSLRAVAHGRLIRVPADLLHRPTPRILQGAERICAGLAGAPHQ